MDIPHELVEQFARGNGVIFVGPELSTSAGLPHWNDLVRRLAAGIQGCPRNASEQDITQYYSIEHGRRRLVERLRDELDTSNVQPTPVHSALVKLSISPIFTTNYDDLLERALQVARCGFDVVVEEIDAGFWSTDRVQLVKLHGSLDRPDSLVITAEDFERYFAQHPALTRLLATALQTRTMLLLGYSANDPDFRRLLTQVQAESGTLARSAFAVQFDADRLVVEDMKRRGIRVINIELRKGPRNADWVKLEEHMEQLATWLTELQHEVKVEKKRQARRSLSRRRQLPAEPYKFLDFFTSEDSAIFHGREYEIELLTSQILAQPLSILYGQSGTGKTSLLKAAVLPQLETEGYCVAYARPLSNTFQEVQASIREALSTRIAGQTETANLYGLVDNSLPAGGRLLIVLDQFEEFFVRQGPETRARFVGELVSMLQIPSRDVRCLLSLRSEYLDRLDELEVSLGRDPLRHRMRLHNLGPAGASAAVGEPAASFGIKLDPVLRDQLLFDLEQVGIAPSQLQIVCYVLWKDWQLRGKPEEGLTLERYHMLGGTGALLADYLDNVIEELGRPDIREDLGLTLDGTAAQEAARAVLKSMITAERTKAVVSGREITHSEIITGMEIAPSQAEALLSYLANRRIIRQLPESGRFELAHEVMIEKVWQWVSEQERHVLDLQDMLARATSDYRKFQSLLPSDRLTLLHEHAASLSLDGDTLELLVVSAVEHKQDSEAWIARMEKDRAVGVLVRLLEMQKRTRYPQIAKALGQTHCDSAIRYLQDLLRSEDAEAQRAAAKALVDLGSPIVVKALYHAMEREYELIRAASILDALEMVPGDEAASMLMLVAMEHRNPHVRSRATNALVRLRCPSGINLITHQLDSDDSVIRENAIRAASRILREKPASFTVMLQDADSEVRLNTIRTLSALGDQQAVGLVAQSLQDEDAQVRREAARAIGHLGDERGVHLLLETLQDEKIEVRIAAAGALGQLEQKQAIEFLFTVLRDETTEVRIRAADALAQSLARSGDPGSIEQLLKALAQENAGVQERITDALRQLGVEEVLLARLHNVDAETRLSSTRVLGAVWKLRAVVELGSRGADVRLEAANALGKLGDQRGVEPLIAALQDESDEVRTATARALGQLGSIRAVDPLVAGLDDVNTEVRLAAAIALARLGDTRAARTLQNALQDSRQYVRAAAATALCQLNDEQGVDFWLATLQDRSTEVRLAAVNTLGRIGDKRTIEPLLGALADDDAEVRRAAVNTLGKIGDKRAIEPLLGALADDDAEVRRAVTRSLGSLWRIPLLVQLGYKTAKVRRRAASGLGRLRDERITQPLVAALRDKSIKVRRAAATSLVGSRNERVYEVLLASLAANDPRMRESAASALGQLGDRRAVEPLVDALEDGSARVRIAAANALVHLGDKRTLKPLLIALQDKNAGVRTAAANAMVHVEDERTLEPLLAALQDEDAGVRTAVANALLRIGNERAIEPLLLALQDESIGMKIAAANALGHMGDERAIEPLLLALQDESPGMRIAAANALGHVGDEQAIEPLLLALQDESVGMRIAAANALGHVGDEQAIEPLLVALQDEHAGVRVAAARALVHTGDERTTEPLAALLWDENAAVQRTAVAALGHSVDRRAAKLLRSALRDPNSYVAQAAREALEILKENTGTMEGHVYQ